jgi:2-dehydro-3-deoxyglucarate aldolase
MPDSQQHAFSDSPIKSLRRPRKADLLGRPSLGSWLTIPHPSVAEMLSRAGFDWLTVDLEHSAISLETAAEMIRVIDLLGIVAFVRVGSHDANVIKRVLDAGAHGVIVSTVNTVEEAKRIANAVRYPPLGTRGVGLSRAQGYSYEFEDHYRWVNEESVVLVQIEHIDGVRNMEGILAVPGVDGYFIGPYDLSASLGVPGKLEHPKMLEALAEVRRCGQASGKVAGVHVVATKPEQAVQKFREGYRLVAFGLDYLFMANLAREGIQGIRQARVAEDRD